MKQTSSLTRNLTAAQETHAERCVRTSSFYRESPPEPSSTLSTATVYRLYTEYKANLATLTARYFDGASVISAVGIWKEQMENSVVIEIIATPADVQKIADLAGDIREVNAQQSVIVTWSDVKRFDIGV